MDTSPITLADPIVAGGVTISEVSAPAKPNVGMLRRWTKIDDDTDCSVQIVVDLCGLTPKQVDALSLDDWDTVQARVSEVIPDSAKPKQADPTSAA